MRIAVFGPPASGKTTLARVLGERFGVPVTHLDHLLFGVDGPCDDATFHARVAEVAAGADWIVEGNFAAVSELVWNPAELVVWLDPPLWMSWWNIVRRSIRQLRGREPGDWRSAYAGRRALLRTVTRKHLRNRPKYEAKMASAQRCGARLVRLGSRTEAQRWLTDIGPVPCPGPDADGMPRPTSTSDVT